MSYVNRWVDAASYIEKAPWSELCAYVGEVASREEVEHALRMAFADDSAARATKLRNCRAFVASLALSETIPRIAPLVFEGLQTAIEDMLAADAKARKKSAGGTLNVGTLRPAATTLGLLAWLRISRTMDNVIVPVGASSSSSGASTSNLHSVQQAPQHTESAAEAKTHKLQHDNAFALLDWPNSVPVARRFLSRVVPLAFVAPFVFASSSSTIPGLLSAITAVASEAGSGVLSVDPSTRCALVCLGAAGEVVETALVTELHTADVQGEKSFFRTPVACPAASDQSSRANDVFTIAHWFNTSDAAAPFTPAQIHHAYLVYALRRSLLRTELSEPAAQRWLSYCECLVKDIEALATNFQRIAGAARGGGAAQQWIISSGTRGTGVRYWDALVREVALMCEAVVVWHQPDSQLSTMLWMLLGHVQTGLRTMLGLREYEPLLEVRDAEGSAANSIQLNTSAIPSSSGNNNNNNNTRGSAGSSSSATATAAASSLPVRPFLCHPEQLFNLCRTALRCDSGCSPAEKTKRAADLMRDVCTEDLLVTLALDPSAVAPTLTAMLRLAAEYHVPLEAHLHLLFSVTSLSPLVATTVLCDHLRFIYFSLQHRGRVELLLRILFLPLTCTALELQMALSEAPEKEDLKDPCFTLFTLWRCLGPISAISRAQTLRLPEVFEAAFALAFDNGSEFKEMWECVMLDDLALMGERERVAAVCVKDSFLDGFFECVAEDEDPPVEGILHAATFTFRFGVFPRMHCASVLKRLVLHVRVLLGGFAGAAVEASSSSSSLQQNSNSKNGGSTDHNNNNNNENNGGNKDPETSVDAAASDDNNNATASSAVVSRGDAMASSLLQFLCGFGSSNVGVLHDDFDRYSDAFFDAVANVLVIAGKFAASRGERAASRVFHSLHDLAWECLAAFRTAPSPQQHNSSGARSSAGMMAAGGGGGLSSGLRHSVLSSHSSESHHSTTGGGSGGGGFFPGSAAGGGGCGSSATLFDIQPNINFVGLRIVGLRSLPSVHERMLKRLEAIAIALTNVTARHVSLRERAVLWLRACWKTAEGWLAQQQVRLRDETALQPIKERCEQLCITCSSLCGLLMHHNDVITVGS